MAKMDLNNLEPHSDDELNDKIKTIIKITWVYAVVVVVIFGFLVYDMLTKQRLNMFIMLPIFLLINFYINYTYIKKIKTELTKRKSKYGN